MTHTFGREGIAMPVIYDKAGLAPADACSASTTCQQCSACVPQSKHLLLVVVVV